MYSQRIIVTLLSFVFYGFVCTMYVPSIPDNSLARRENSLASTAAIVDGHIPKRDQKLTNRALLNDPSKKIGFYCSKTFYDTKKIQATAREGCQKVVAGIQEFKIKNLKLRSSARSSGKVEPCIPGQTGCQTSLPFAYKGPPNLFLTLNKLHVWPMTSNSFRKVIGGGDQLVLDVKNDKECKPIGMVRQSSGRFTKCVNGP